MENFKKVALFIGLIILFILALVGLNSIANRPAQAPNIDEARIILFSSPTCPHCRNVADHIKNNDIDDYINIVTLDTTVPGNAVLFQEYCALSEEADVYGCGVPLMYDKETEVVLMGDLYINEYLDQLVEELSQNATGRFHLNLIPKAYAQESVSSTTVNRTTNPPTLPVVIAGGLADSFNPCAWSAKIFLLTTLIGLKASRKKLIKMSIAYIATVFAAYFLIGIGLFSFLSYIGSWVNVIYGVLAGIILIFALIELKDVFWYGKGVSLQIPKNQWDRIEKTIKKATLPAAITLGLLVTVLEFGCTGGIYVPIIAMLSSQETSGLAIIYLTIYNFLFVLPLIIILALFLNGYTLGKIEQFRQKHRKLMRLISGLVMIGLAVILILQIT